MYNLQSGIRRHSYPAKVSPAQARKLTLNREETLNGAWEKRKSYGPGEGKHSKAVTGLMVDTLNTLVVSCSLDGKVKVCSCLIQQLC